MNLLLGTMSITLVVVLYAFLKLRKMPKYKIIKEADLEGVENWFVKVRKGFNYLYLIQTHDAPGYENDIFKKSKYQDGAQESQKLAEKLIINHRMTTVNGIEVEGE